MKKEVIFTKKAARPGGSYSQAIKAGNLVFVSGCTGVNPETGKLTAPVILSSKPNKPLRISKPSWSLAAVLLRM